MIFECFIKKECTSWIRKIIVVWLNTIKLWFSIKSCRKFLNQSCIRQIQFDWVGVINADVKIKFYVLLFKLLNFLKSTTFPTKWLFWESFRPNSEKVFLALKANWHSFLHFSENPVITVKLMCRLLLSDETQHLRDKIPFVMVNNSQFPVGFHGSAQETVLL